jgi:hypothetical protein
MGPRNSLKNVEKNEHVSSGLRNCLKDVDLQSRDEAPMLSRPLSRLKARIPPRASSANPVKDSCVLSSKTRSGQELLISNVSLSAQPSSAKRNVITSISILDFNGSQKENENAVAGLGICDVCNIFCLWPVRAESSISRRNTH